MLTSLFATSDLARRVAVRNWEVGSLTFFIAKQPIGVNAQRVCECLKFVVEHTTVIVFDLGNRGSVELNPESSELPGKGVLRQRWLIIVTCLSHAPANDVFAHRLLDHTERVPSAKADNVLN